MPVSVESVLNTIRTAHTLANLILTSTTGRFGRGYIHPNDTQFAPLLPLVAVVVAVVAAAVVLVVLEMAPPTPPPPTTTTPQQPRIHCPMYTKNPRFCYHCHCYCHYHHCCYHWDEALNQRWCQFHKPLSEIFVKSILETITALTGDTRQYNRLV